MKSMKNPNFGTACDTCVHLRGPAKSYLGFRDRHGWYECFKDRPEFYESGDTCPEQGYRADASEEESEELKKEGGKKWI